MNDDSTTIQMRASRVLRPIGLVCGAALLMMSAWMHQACGSEAGDTDDSEPSRDANTDGAQESRCEPACEADELCIDGSCEPDEEMCIDLDGDGYGRGCPLGDDCDDTDPLINPGRPEICDGVDNNCNFYIDEGGVCDPCEPSCASGDALCSGNSVVRCDDSLACPRFGEAVPCAPGTRCRSGICEQECVDADGDGFFVNCDEGPEDCDDTRSDVYPGAPEVCDGIDNNCNGRIDEGGVCDEPCEDECDERLTECTADGTGIVRCERGPNGCTRLSGVVVCSSGGCASGVCVATPVCVDLDGDGFGPGCEAGPDCRPLDPSSFPGAPEVCNGVDNNCDGIADSGGACSVCVEATLASPAVLAIDTPLYRMGCGGNEYIRIQGARRNQRVMVLLSAEGVAPPMTPGTIVDGRFEARGSSFVLGTSRAYLAGDSDASDLVVRVQSTNGERYALVWGDASAPCEDSYEPNNAPHTASPLGTAPFIGSAGICASDFDFFQVSTRPGQVIDVAMLADPSTGAQSLVSIWRNGVELAPGFGGPPTAEGQPRGRATHFRTDLPGDYVVGVRALITSQSLRYLLAVEVIGEDACTDDADERTDGVDDDTIATARELRPGTTVRGVICPGDFDVFRLGELRSGGNINGSFEVNAGAGELEARVLYRGWGAPRDFPTGVSADGVYYLVVYGKTSQDGGGYTLTYRR